MDGISLGRWDWLLLSVAIATLGALVQWVVAHQATSPRRPESGTRWRTLNSIIAHPWFAQPLRALYAIGVPAFAFLANGALTARGLGLKPFSFWPAQPGLSDAVPAYATGGWLGDLGWFALLTSATLVVVAIGNHNARSRLIATGEKPGPRSILLAALDALVYQAHWAFYREPFVVLWGIAAGSWLGTLPVLAETALNLVFWERLRSGDVLYARRLLIRGGVLIATTQLYLKTQNLWLAVLLDLAIGWLMIQQPRRQSVTREAITTTR